MTDAPSILFELDVVGDDEPAAAAVGRIMLANRLDREVNDLATLTHDIVERAHMGESLTESDVEEIERRLRQIESVLDDYARPVASEGSE